MGGVPRRQAVAVRAARARPAGGRSGRREARRTARGRPRGSSTPTTRRPGAFIGVTQEAGARVLTYGTDPAADVRATRIEEDAGGLRIAYDGPVRWRRRVELRLAGRFNVHNALAVVALGEARRAWIRRPSATGLASARASCPGRMERVDARPAVRGHRRLRPQPGVAPDRARPARARRRGARRRPDRGLRVGRRARHGQAAADGPDRRRALPGSSSSPTRTRAARTATRSSTRSPVAPRPPASAAATTCC